MAITNFLPNVWSETLYAELDREYIAVKNCNRDFEGDIRGRGSAVKICGIGQINVFQYLKDEDMDEPQTLSDFAQTLTIDQAMAFNFQIDDIDRAQATPKLMQLAMKQAAAALAEEAEHYVYTKYSECLEENIVSVDSLNPDNAVDMLIMARQKLLENNINSNTPTSLEVSPEVAAILLKAKVLQSSDNSGVIDNGSLGTFVGFDVFVSPHVISLDGRHKCFVRTKRAISFAEQINDVDAYRPELRFADAVKGLHLYGAKVVYPREFVVLDVALD